MGTVRPNLKSFNQLERRSFGAEAVVDFSSDPDTWRRELDLWRELGGTHLSLRAMDTAAELVGARRVGYRGPQHYIEALESFWKAIS